MAEENWTRLDFILTYKELCLQCLPTLNLVVIIIASFISPCERYDSSLELSPSFNDTGSLVS